MKLEDVGWGDLLSNIGPPIAKLVLVVVAIRIAGKLITKVLASKKGKFTPQLQYVAPRVVRGLGLILVLEVLGIDTSSFLALFATIGIGAALIFTPVGQGLIAGFLAGMDDVVKEGDIIEVLNRPGRVTRIGALSIGVEFPDGSLVYLPNVKTIDDELINHNRVDGARIMVEIKLNLDPDRAKAVQIMEATLEGLSWRRVDKPTAVHFTEIGANAYHYSCYAWIDNRLDEPGYKSQMLTALVDGLEAAGITCGETSDLSLAAWPSGSDFDVDLTAAAIQTQNPSAN